MRRNNKKKPPAPARANAAINGSAPRGYAAQIAVSTPVPDLGALILDAGEWALSAIYHLITNQGTAAIEARCDTAIDADLIITRADLPTQAQANLLSIFAGCVDSRRVFTPSSFDDRGIVAAEHQVMPEPWIKLIIHPEHPKVLRLAEADRQKALRDKRPSVGMSPVFFHG